MAVPLGTLLLVKLCPPAPPPRRARAQGRFEAEREAFVSARAKDSARGFPERPMLMSALARKGNRLVRHACSRKESTALGDDFCSAPPLLRHRGHALKFLL